MTTSTQGIGTDGSSLPQLLDAPSVGALLMLDRKTVERHAKTGKMPRPVKIGGSTRWRRAELDAWILAGCPPLAKWELTDVGGKFYENN